MRLLRVELLRLRSRRLVKVLFALLFLVLALTAVLTIATHEIDAARPDKAYRLVDELSGLMTVFGVLTAGAMFVMGASAAGAEWAAGTMQGLLYWEPRRVRVMIAKVAAVLVLATALVLAVEALVTLVAYVAANMRGITDGATAGFWTSHVLRVVRVGGMVWFAAVAGFAIAFGTRNTGAALGAGFVYFLAEQFVITWKPWLARWSLTGNIVGWVSGGIDGPSNDGETSRIYMGESGWTLLAYAIVAIAVATMWMRQRDVT